MPMHQLPLPIAREPARSFASFVSGGNRLALDGLRQARPGAPPIYLWGPPGCGKTHLLQALSEERRREGQPLGWFDAASPLPWVFDVDWQLLVLDRCDEFDLPRQQAAFALFVDATDQGVPVAAAGRLPPVDLPLREDLRSRLGWGQVLALQPLSEAETRAALAHEAGRRGIDLGDEVMAYLLTRCARDLKSLMTLLDRLDRYALGRQRAVTVPLLREMLAGDPS